MDPQNEAVRYSTEELDALEAHIEQHYGKIAGVFHEIASPDIHVDLYIVEPTPERDYYTLLTLGMGARRMTVPDELAERQLDRAELLVCLPRDWEIKDTDERWYWPLRWLKILARLPGEQDTWLGWGHTVPNGEEPIADTAFTGMLLVTPGAFAEEAAECVLPGGDEVNFYQMIPLYEEELRFKVEHDAGSLLERMSQDMLETVAPGRRNACVHQPPKQYKLRPEDIKPLLQWDGARGCLATDRITVDGCRVGYLYREDPDPEMPDSGWRFTAGDESEEYMNDAANSGIYDLNTICNCDPDIIGLLQSPSGSAFVRGPDGKLHPDPGA